MPRQVHAALPRGESRLAVREAFARQGVRGTGLGYELRRIADPALAP